MRHLIAELLQIPAAELPLQAPPGQAPELKDGWGFVSLSHCPDALLVAWSPWRIGVDLERADRRIPADALVRRFFCNAEQPLLLALSDQQQRQAVLEHWVRKEAAIKWQRGSLACDLAHWCCEPDGNLVVDQRDGTQLCSVLWQEGDWTLALVASARDVVTGANPVHSGMLCLA